MVRSSNLDQTRYRKCLGMRRHRTITSFGLQRCSLRSTRCLLHTRRPEAASRQTRVAPVLRGAETQNTARCTPLHSPPVVPWVTAAGTTLWNNAATPEVQRVKENSHEGYRVRLFELPCYACGPRRRGGVLRTARRQPLRPERLDGRTCSHARDRPLLTRRPRRHVRWRLAARRQRSATDL